MITKEEAINELKILYKSYFSCPENVRPMGQDEFRNLRDELIYLAGDLVRGENNEP